VEPRREVEEPGTRVVIENRCQRPTCESLRAQWANHGYVISANPAP